jgi:molybdate transport system regulatory protein
MGMPYKRAWMLLDSINQAFNERVVEAATGGARGGGATLTPFGAEILERYGRLHDQANGMAVEDVAALEQRARSEIGPKV